MQMQHSALTAIVAAARARPAPLVRRAKSTPGYVDGTQIRRAMSIALEALAGQDVTVPALMRRHGIACATAKRMRVLLREFGLTARGKGGRQWQG